MDHFLSVAVTIFMALVTMLLVLVGLAIIQR